MAGQATVLPPCNKAMVCLQKHKPYNFLHYAHTNVMQRWRQVATAGGAPRV